jgi:hypothetical protein
MEREREREIRETKRLLEAEFVCESHLDFIFVYTCLCEKVSNLEFISISTIYFH